MKIQKIVDKPFKGLFGSSIHIRVLEEIVADPYRPYRPKDIQELVGASNQTIEKSLTNLTKFNLLHKDDGDEQHPIYYPNLKSKVLLALTLLSYALIDDTDGTDCMDMAMLDHLIKMPMCNENNKEVKED